MSIAVSVSSDLCWFGFEKFWNRVLYQSPSLLQTKCEGERTFLYVNYISTTPAINLKFNNGCTANTEVIGQAEVQKSSHAVCCSGALQQQQQGECLLPAKFETECRWACHLHSTRKTGDWDLTNCMWCNIRNYEMLPRYERNAIRQRLVCLMWVTTPAVNGCLLLSSCFFC